MVGIESIEGQLEQFFKIECAICGDMDEVKAEDRQSAATEFYQDGWRYSISETYGHIGTHCTICHPIRNRKENDDT